MSNTSIANPTAGVKLAAIFISFSCLTVSVYQGGQFVADLAITEQGRVMLFVAAFALIAGGQVLARLIGFSIRDGAPVWMVALGVIVIIAITGYSIATSTNALTKHAFERINQENKASPEYRRMLRQEQEYQAQINELRDTRETMPANWITKRTETSDRIRVVSARLERIRDDMRNPDASVTAKTLSAVQDSTGLQTSHMALLFAVLLDAVPLVVNLLLGFATDRRREEKAGQEKPVGKKSKPDLRAVA